MPARARLAIAAPGTVVVTEGILGRYDGPGQRHHRVNCRATPGRAAAGLAPTWHGIG